MVPLFVIVEIRLPDCDSLTLVYTNRGVFQGKKGIREILKKESDFSNYFILNATLDGREFTR